MFTFYQKNKGGRKMYLLFVPLLAAFLAGCYQSDDVQSFRKNTQGENTFSFYDYKNGGETHWKVYFKDDSITALYRNGIRIPDAEVKNYEDMIYDKINDIAGLRRERDKDVMFYSFNNPPMPLEMDKMHGKRKFDIHIDKDFKDGMKKLRIEMDKLKDKDFLGPEFHENMKKIKKELKILHNDSTNSYIFHFDGKDLENELENLADELKDVEISINIPDENINLDEIDKNLGDVDVELKDLDEDLKNLDKFFEDLKTEMIKDKLIDNESDEISLRLDKDKMYVNDKEVPAETYQKYKEMYKKYTGKDFEENHYFHFNIDK